MTCQVFRVSRRRMMVFLIGCLVFVLLGLGILSHGGVGGWGLGGLCVVFFGLGIPLSIANLIAPPRLQLDLARFQAWQPLGQRTSARWVNCGPFTAQSQTRTASLIVFDCSEMRNRRLVGLNRAFVGQGRAVQGNYRGISPADLARLMNQYRDAAMNRPR